MNRRALLGVIGLGLGVAGARAASAQPPVLDAKTAKAIGVTIPPLVMLRADRVIE